MKKERDKIEVEIRKENFCTHLFAKLMQEYRENYIRTLKAS